MKSVIQCVLRALCMQDHDFFCKRLFVLQCVLQHLHTYMYICLYRYIYMYVYFCKRNHDPICTPPTLFIFPQSPCEKELYYMWRGKWSASRHIHSYIQMKCITSYLFIKRQFIISYIKMKCITLYIFIYSDEVYPLMFIHTFRWSASLHIDSSCITSYIFIYSDEVYPFIFIRMFRRSASFHVECTTSYL